MGVTEEEYAQMCEDVASMDRNLLSRVFMETFIWIRRLERRSENEVMSDQEELEHSRKRLYLCAIENEWASRYPLTS